MNDNLIELQEKIDDYCEKHSNLYECQSCIFYGSSIENCIADSLESATIENLLYY